MDDAWNTDNANMEKVIEGRDIHNLDIDKTALLLKRHARFGHFSTRKLKSVLKGYCKDAAMTLALVTSSLYHGWEWSPEHKGLFAAACRAVRLDLHFQTLKAWVTWICRAMEGAIPARDVFDKLSTQYNGLLERAGIRVHDADEVDPDLDYLDLDEACEERLGTGEAMYAFRRAKRQGPAHRCGCCGKLDFLDLFFLTPRDWMHPCGHFRICRKRWTT